MHFLFSFLCISFGIYLQVPQIIVRGSWDELLFMVTLHLFLNTIPFIQVIFYIFYSIQLLAINCIHGLKVFLLFTIFTFSIDLTGALLQELSISSLVELLLGVNQGLGALV
jgi:hypothetical protein